jgi:hypothetical protein
LSDILEDVTPDPDDEEQCNEIYLQKLQEFRNKRLDSQKLKVGTLQSIRCAAHTVQLCATDLMQVEEIKTHVLHCRNIVKFLRKSSSGYWKVFNNHDVQMPPLDAAPRWLSTYDMLNALRLTKKFFQDSDITKLKNGKDCYLINSELWDFLEVYCAALAPVKKAILRFQVEKLNFGDFYADWLRMKLLIENKLSNYLAESSHPHLAIYEMLDKSIKAREKKLMRNEGLNACLFLDPRFHVSIYLFV